MTLFRRRVKSTATTATIKPLRLTADDFREIDRFLLRQSPRQLVTWSMFDVRPDGGRGMSGTSVTGVDELLEADPLRRGMVIAEVNNFTEHSEPVDVDTLSVTMRYGSIEIRAYNQAGGGAPRSSNYLDGYGALAGQLTRECRPRLTVAEVYAAVRWPLSLAIAAVIVAAWVTRPDLWPVNTIVSLTGAVFGVGLHRRLQARSNALLLRTDRPIPLERLTKVEAESIRIETRQKWLFAGLGAVIAVVTGVIVAAVRYIYFGG